MKSEQNNRMDNILKKIFSKKHTEMVKSTGKDERFYDLTNPYLGTNKAK